MPFNHSTQLLWHCFPTKGQAEVSAEAGTSWQGAGPCQSRDLCHPCGAAHAPSLPGATEDGFPLLLLGLHHVLSVASGGAQTNMWRWSSISWPLVQFPSSGQSGTPSLSFPAPAGGPCPAPAVPKWWTFELGTGWDPCSSLGPDECTRSDYINIIFIIIIFDNCISPWT